VAPVPDDESKKDRDEEERDEDASEEESEGESSEDGGEEGTSEGGAADEESDEDAGAEGAQAAATADSDDEEDEDDEEKDASPDAIAKRVAALGPADELSAIAEAEERKLAVRKRKRRGKRGLEAAASKRLKKIAAKAPKAKRPVSAAVEAADPLLERTQALGDWAKKNQKLVGGVIAAALAVFLGFALMTYLDQKKAMEASVTLAAAVADQRGRVGEVKEDEDDEDKPKDTTPIFKTAEDRRNSALSKYREVSSRYKGTGAATLARLAEGSLLLDARDADGAAAAFSEVKASPLATADAEVKGRALEGLGFAYELKAQLDAAQAPKHLEDAEKTFRELENTDVEGFKELGMYHQARVAEARGDKDKAKELLKSLHERLTQPGGTKYTYLQEVSDARLRALDPLALPPKPPGMLGGPGGNRLTEAQLRQLFEQLQKHGGGGGGHQE
jgi:hypothetical protein